MTRTSVASHWTVRTLLVWLVLACLLPGVIGATALFVYEYRQSRAELEKTTLRTARALVQAVDNHLLRAVSVAQTLSTSNALARGEFDVFHERAREVMALLDLDSNVVLRDEAGRQILNTAVDFGEPLIAPAAPEQVRGVFASGKPTVSDVFIGPVLKRPVMSVDVPVRIDGEVKYALGIGIVPDHFNRLLQSQSLPSGWIAGVFDSSGAFVGRTLTPERLVGKKAPEKLVLAMMELPEGWVEATTPEGVPVLASFSRSELTGWRVSIATPRDTYWAALLRTLSVLALWTLALFGVALALARLMGRRIARSIEALIAPAIALGSGRSVPVPWVDVQEAAEVATAIGRAADLLNERKAALKAREAELAQAHRLARFGTWSWNLVTGEVRASDSIREIYGREVPPFPQQRGTLLTVESWERVNAASGEALRTGKGYDLDLEVNHGSGATIWVNARCQAERNAQGEVVALHGTIQDITERRRADERVRESEERFRLLADNIAQLAWMADEKGSIYWYNRRWFDYTGTTLDEMQGWGWQRVYHPDHVERVAAKLRRCFETGEPWEDTFPLRGADGRYRWFLSRAVPERDASGRVLRWFGTNTDVTEQRETEEELRKFKFFSDHANEVNLLIDQTGAIRYANRLACERFGYSEAEMVTLNISNIDPLYPGERFREIFVRSKEARLPPFESMAQRKDGSTFPVEVTATVLEHKGEWLMFATSRDISERKEVEQRVRTASLHDALTGLPNRALVFEYCEHLLAAARRGHGRGALLFIDLDRFKPINDHHGHEIGDRVLQEVGRRLAACTREEDLVGRLGGDEFVVVLPYLEADHHLATVVAQHVIDSINRPFHVDALELALSPSIGISFFPEHADDVSDLIHAADMAMYQAKQSGRANYQIYTPELDQRAEAAHSLESRLRRALKQNRLALHYQPVIDLFSGRLIGAEALVRLADGDEAVGPARFIPIAESVGLIAELGEWVAAEACRQREAWQEEGLALTIAINVSPLQFRQRAFAQRLHDIISTTGIDPSCLEIEVTESTVMENVDEAVGVLKRLKALGVKVALDDFGTGYSSLASLSCLPLDKLKVDQSFVRRIEADAASRAVTEAIIALGHSLKLDVVGEGIESEGALRYLQEQGCNQAQGFWFSQPLPPSEFAQWCREYRGRTVAAAGRA